MRTHPIVAAGLLGALAVPAVANAIVVVRARPRPVATVVAVGVVVAVATKPPPPTPPPPPSAPPPPPVTTPLPIDSTMWVLPSGCLKVSVKGEAYFQCGPSWLKPQATDKGQPYFQVVPPPSS
jgi:hypothetical protein